MNKILLVVQLIAVSLLYVPTSYAHDHHGWDHGGREYHEGHGWRGHHGHGWGHHQPYYREEVIYYPQPGPRYYYQEPRGYYQDPRSTQGLAGGVIGSVFGYQLGGGDPIATGVGAAAGSFLGNEMSGRR